MALTGNLLVPDVAGESVRADHEDEIDVHRILWNVSQGASAQTGKGRSKARAIVGELTCAKYYDASSPYLALAAMQGKSFDEVKVAVRKDSGEAHLDYLVITMTNVIISDYSILPTADDELVIEESVSFTFEEVQIKYTVQADDHSAGDEHEIEYDIASGV